MAKEQVKVRKVIVLPTRVHGVTRYEIWVERTPPDQRPSWFATVNPTRASICSLVAGTDAMVDVTWQETEYGPTLMDVTRV